MAPSSLTRHISRILPCTALASGTRADAGTGAETVLGSSEGTSKSLDSSSKLGLRLKTNSEHSVLSNAQ